MLDSLPFGVIVTDNALRITSINHWITDQIAQDNNKSNDQLLTDKFPEIKDRGLDSIYKLVLETEQKITVSNRIHKYIIKIQGNPDSGLDYMPQSTVVAPIIENNTLMGTVTIISDVGERVLTEKFLNHEIDKLSTLRKVDQALTILNLQTCLDIIITQAKNLFHADAVAVYFVEDHQLVLAASDGLPESNLPLADTLTEWSFKNQKSKIINFNKTSSPFTPLIAGSQTEFAVPFINNEACIGLIHVAITHNRLDDKYDMELLEGMAARATSAIQNARLHEESEYWREYYQKVNGRLNTLLSANQLMNKQADLKQLIISMTKLFADVFDADFVSILKIDPDSEILDKYSSWGDKTEYLQNCPINQNNTTQLFFKDYHSAIFSDLTDVTYLSKDCQKELINSGFCRLMAAGLHKRNSLSGIIHIYSSNPERVFQPEEQELFEALSAQLSLAIENSELLSMQQKLAETDGLTGVFNRRRFDKELVTWMERSHRSNRPISLIIMDIDNFKRFNDTFGHQTGDEVLQLLASMVVKNSRSVDIVARYGGEEFVVILPDTSIDVANKIAERIRSSTSGLLKSAMNPLVHDETLTISLGVATAPFQAIDDISLIKAADQFLYEAKHTGKNKVVTAM